jgi:hypothetical protein
MTETSVSLLERLRDAGDWARRHAEGPPWPAAVLARMMERDPARRGPTAAAARALAPFAARRRRR